MYSTTSIAGKSEINFCKKHYYLITLIIDYIYSLNPGLKKTSITIAFHLTKYYF